MGVLQDLHLEHCLDLAFEHRKDLVKRGRKPRHRFSGEIAVFLLHRLNDPILFLHLAKPLLHHLNILRDGVFQLDLVPFEEELSEALDADSVVVPIQGFQKGLVVDGAVILQSSVEVFLLPLLLIRIFSGFILFRLSD